jgi:magnesium-transporting ATPase (P-type)
MNGIAQDHTICFLGSNAESGSATGVVIHTGDKTDFGSLAASIVGQRVLTSLDKGVDKFTWLMIRFIAVMVPAVFLINGLSRHDWPEAFLFAMAVAVGLIPEMLPMIVTVNLSKGALAMARKNEIITAYICKEVGMSVEHVLLGSQIEAMSEAELAERQPITIEDSQSKPAEELPR